ncbi:RNA polymerase sigma factor [Nocardioides lentus]|uniref:RNA polymerase sigma factor n=1 Tax=Nocardioides lentus TaxID=338077 RepID=A0ABP5AUW7_9ACTN
MSDTSPDEDRLTRLFEQYAVRLRLYARRQVGAAEADDLVAEAFVVALRRPEALPDGDAEVWPWLVGTARRLAANHRRRLATRDRHWQEVVREHWRNGAGSPEVAVAERDACLAALAALPAADRELLLLVAWEGLTADQAARVLDVRRGTLAVRLHRARRRLAALTDGPTDQPPTLLRPAAAQE